MTTDNVTALPGVDHPALVARALKQEREKRELAAHLMAAAVRAAIILIDTEQPPMLAADILQLAREHWDRACGAS